MRWCINLAIVLFVTSAATHANAGGCSVVKLPHGKVVLYSKPSASSTVVAQLQDPQLDTLEDPNESSEWIHVSIEGKEGLRGWVKGNRVHSSECG
jgi:hypothetical protein